MHKKIKLQSKRNSVYRIVTDNGTYISKKFNSIEDYNKEKEILNILTGAGVRVPSIISSQNNSLYMKDLGDFTLLRWYEEQEKNNTLDEKLLYKLSFWLRDFYKAVYNHYNEEIILHDINFRNFIIFESEIYGIDFEQVRQGSICEDIGRFSAYALTYHPVMTRWKINFRNKFIDILSKELKIKKENIVAEENKELLAIEKRRGISLVIRR